MYNRAPLIIRVSTSSEPVYWLTKTNKAEGRRKSCDLVGVQGWPALPPCGFTDPSVVHYVLTTPLFKGQAEQKVHSCRVVVNMQIVAHLCWTIFEFMMAQLLRIRSFRKMCGTCVDKLNKLHPSLFSPSLSCSLFTYLIILRIQGRLHALHVKTEQMKCKFSWSTILALNS